MTLFFCPRCSIGFDAYRSASTELFLRRIDDATPTLEGYQCPRCMGVLMTHSQLEIVTGGPLDLAALEERGSVTPGGSSELACPCHRETTTMHLHYAHFSGKSTQIDLCHSCKAA